ncbi:extracellular solute-binding protein [Kozakia baliensis]|nr:extracellular solute-binding protein [Kozakia baliensis]
MSAPAMAHGWLQNTWHNLFGANAASRHSHHGTHHVQHHKPKTPAPPPPVFVVPTGTIAANALSMPDQPFALHEWDGSLITLREHALGAPTNWVAVLMDNTSLHFACRDGLVQMLPTIGDNTSLPAGTSPCGLPGGQSSLVLAWDRSRVGDPAPDWSDFWDVARHPGKRSLRLDPRSTLEIALLADGVAPADVYSVLSTEAGVDRAFRKLDQLRPYIVWWRTPEDATRIMSSGAALMIGTPIDELAALPKPVNFAVQWRQSLRQNLSWAIPHNVPNPSAEHVAIVLRDQAPRHEDTQDGPLPDGSILTINDNFWATHLESLQKRFQDWFSPPP